MIALQSIMDEWFRMGIPVGMKSPGGEVCGWRLLAMVNSGLRWFEGTLWQQGVGLAEGGQILAMSVGGRWRGLLEFGKGGGGKGCRIRCRRGTTFLRRRLRDHLLAKAATGRMKIGGDGGDAKGRNRGLATSGEKSRSQEFVRS